MHLKTFAIACGLLLLATTLHAQCRGFTRKKCAPTLESYTFNGQLNSAVLAAGETAELTLDFNSGIDYRLLVCSHPVLGDVAFKVLDTDNTEIYDSANSDHDYFDFNVAGSRQLIVQIAVPPSESNTDLVHEGCVSIVLGFKEP